MKKNVVLCIALLMLVSAAAWAQPAIRAENGVVNASSYTSGIARGSWFVVFGTGMGPSTLAVYSGNLPYPTTHAGTSVTFTPVGGGAAVNALIWYTAAGQLAGLLPSSTLAGEYDVRVTYNGQTSAPRRVTVVERNFGFATQSQNGAGPAQATYGGLDLNRFTTGMLGQWSTRPAKVGDTIVLWGTGLGADLNSDISGATSGDQTAAAQVRVVLGGVEITPLYAGRSNGSPGLDQINFPVTQNVVPGCFVSLSVKAGGRTSNLGSIAVAEPGSASCSHPTLTTAQLSKLDQGGKLVIGDLSLSKISFKITVPIFGTVTTTSEVASGSFGSYGVDTFLTAGFSTTQIGSCFVFGLVGTQEQIIEGTLPTELDAGAQLRLNGPNAANIAIPHPLGSMDYESTLYSSGFGGLGASGSPTLAQGTYTFSGTGGADVGAFTASLSVPGDFVWTNADTLPNPIPRGAGLGITWTGGGTGLVSTTGIAFQRIGGTEEDPIFDAKIFSCIAQASAGNFTVPAAVLQQLPAASGDPATGSFGNLTVVTIPDASTGQGAFSAPLTGGGTIDQGYFSYAVGESKITGWN